MSKIKRIDSHSLTNGAFFQLIESITVIGNTEPLVQPMLGDLTADIALMQTSFKKEQLNAETNEIIAADVLRDRAFIRLRKIVEAYLFDDQVAANKPAAEEIDGFLKQYGGGSLKNYDYNKESAYLTNLVKDLNEKAEPSLATLGIARNVQYLGSCNDTFIEVYAKRGDAAQKLENIPPFTKLRKQVNQHYNTFIVYVESLKRVNTDAAEQLDALINRINVEIEKYKLLINKTPEKITEEK